jgi:hypothetical protein
MGDSIVEEDVYKGLRNTGNNKAGQKREYVVYAANFGLTERPQKST